MKKNVCITLLAVVFCLTAPRAEAQEWDWEFTNSGQTYQPGTEIVMEAQIWSSGNDYDLESSINSLTFGTDNFSTYYNFSFGPSGADWREQFEDVTIGPGSSFGTSYDFIFGVLDPKTSSISEETTFAAVGEINHSWPRDFTATVTPEPASMFLMGSGLLTLLGFRKRK